MNRMFNPPPLVCSLFSHNREDDISLLFFSDDLLFSYLSTFPNNDLFTETNKSSVNSKDKPISEDDSASYIFYWSVSLLLLEFSRAWTFLLFKSKTFLHIILAPLIRSRNDSVRSIVRRSLFPFLIAIFNLHDSVCFIIHRKVFVSFIVHLTESEGVSWISNGSNVPVSIFTFHHNHEIYSSKFVCILNKSLFFVISWESVVSNRSFMIRREFWFFSLCIFCTYWIFYRASLLIVKPNSFRFFSWISFISFLKSLFFNWSSACFVSYFAFTFFKSSWRRYSWTSHSWEFFMISSWICHTLSTSLWNHCAS